MTRLADTNPSPPGRVSGVFSLYSLTGAALLVNVLVETPFEYGTLYHLTSLAIRCGGVMEVCNECIAIYAFPNGGIQEFMEKIIFAVQVSKTMVSPKDKGISKVNIRFRAG